MKVLITGGSGFIGRNFFEVLQRQFDVLAPTRGELDLMSENSVRDYLRHHLFDVVIHAATVRANRRIGAPSNLMEQNCRMYFNLARCSEIFGKMLFLSSGAVYDRRTPVIRIPETCFDRSVPTDPYGFAKYICGQHALLTSNIFDLRLFGVFGPYEDWQIRFLSNACCRAVRGLPVLLKQNMLLDYLDVADLAQVMQWFVENQPRHRSYNVCTSRDIDLADFARLVVRASGKNLAIQVQEPGLGGEYSGDNRRLLEEAPALQFRSPDESIYSLYRWYDDHKADFDPNHLHFDAPAMAAVAANSGVTT